MNKQIIINIIFGAIGISFFPIILVSMYYFLEKDVQRYKLIDEKETKENPLNIGDIVYHISAKEIPMVVISKHRDNITVRYHKTIPYNKGSIGGVAILGTGGFSGEMDSSNEFVTATFNYGEVVKK
jgi:hypothetical protein